MPREFNWAPLVSDASFIALSFTGAHKVKHRLSVTAFIVNSMDGSVILGQKFTQFQKIALSYSNVYPVQAHWGPGVFPELSL